jgi:hypothetical protein
MQARTPRCPHPMVTAAAAATGLCAAYDLGPPLLALSLSTFPLAPARSDIVPADFATTPNPLFRGFVLLIAIVAVALFAVAWAESRWSTVKVRIGLVSVPLIWSSLHGICPFALVAMWIAAARLVVHASPAPAIDDGARMAAWQDRLAIVLQHLALGWACHLALPSIAATVISSLVAGLTCLWRLRSRSGNDAAAAIPLSLTPLLGLLRDAPAWPLLAASLAYVALRLAAPSPRRRLALAVGAAGATSVLLLPYGFRELGMLNAFTHESGQFAWTNSILHGRLMMADSGLIYGPLRAYIVAAIAFVAGATAEHVREAQILMNFVSVALLGFLLAAIARSSLQWLAGLFAMTAGTFVVFWCVYFRTVSFGWADIGRCVFPMAAAWWTSRPRFGVRFGLSYRIVSGALLGVTVLYAQEFGLAALAASALAPFGSGLALALRRHSLRPLRAAARRTGIVVAGALIAVSVFAVIYGVSGRLPRLVRSAAISVTLFGSGQYLSTPAPIGRSTFSSFAALTAPDAGPGSVLEYASIVFIYLLAMTWLSMRARQRWSSAHSSALVTLLFGMACFKVALSRADLAHLLSTVPPAVLLAVMMAADKTVGAAPARCPTPAPVTMRGVAFLRALMFAAMAYLVTRGTGFRSYFVPRAERVLAGLEQPSRGPKYTYPDIPRAGDVKIDAGTLAVVRIIRSHTQPSDFIASSRTWTDSSEVFFLADRRNATRFDTPCEMATVALRDEAFQSVKALRPKAIFGENHPMLGDAFRGYITANYRVVGTFEGLSIALRNDVPF